MKLTKYEHACFTVEKDDQVLVVDPGNFTTDFIAPEHVVAVVITHEHADHLDPDVLAAIYNKNPDSLLLGDSEVIKKMPDHRGQAVKPGDVVTVGPFSLEFFGGEHAIIHPSIPPIANLAVLVNDLLYYPGDSFTIPFRSIDTLALPASAPWMRLSEAMDFLAEIKPRFAFPTHDAILSSAGQAMVDRLLGNVATVNGIDYRRLTETLAI